MQRTIGIILGLALSIGVWAAAARVGFTVHRQGLVGGAPSVEALVGEFLEAIEAKDEAALHRLRVSRDEYLGIVVPGSVEPGKPLRDHLPEQTTTFFWSLLDTKSRYYAENLLEAFGGREWPSPSIDLTVGRHEYASYNALGEVRLRFRLDSGETQVLPTGWIAEVDGTYKFIGFEYDD